MGMTSRVEWIKERARVAYGMMIESCRVAIADDFGDDLLAAYAQHRSDILLQTVVPACHHVQPIRTYLPATTIPVLYFARIFHDDR